MKFISRQKITLFVILGIFLVFTGLSAHNFAQSERFGDEVGHFIGGHVLLKGNTIYKDVQLNHQPLMYFFSAATEKLTSPGNLFHYVSRQRDAVFVYSAAWYVLLVALFGLPGLIFSILFEMSKYVFSGYKLLGETLAVYPTIYIFFILSKLYLFKEELKNHHLLIMSMSTFIAAFSLLPLWPFLVCVNALLIWKYKNDRKKLIHLLAPFFVLTSVLFVLFVPMSAYIRETITYNTQYFLPSRKETPPFLGQILLPFYAYFPPYETAKILLLVLFSTIVFQARKVYSKHKKTIFVLGGLLFLTNFRVDSYIFDSFHLLPFYSGALVLAILSIIYNVNKARPINKKTRNTHGILILLFGFFVFTTYPSFYTTKDKVLEQNYNFYSTSETHGRVIKILKGEDDKLFIAWNDPIVHWVAQIDTPMRFLEGYSWVLSIPEYNTEFNHMLEEDLPEFFIVNDIKGEAPMLENKMVMMLNENYVQLLHLEKPSKIFVHKNKLDEISDEQLQLLRDMLFDLPELPQ